MSESERQRPDHTDRVVVVTFSKRRGDVDSARVRHHSQTPHHAAAQQVVHEVSEE